MKPARYSKWFLYAALSILILLAAPAMAQNASPASDMAEAWDEETAAKISFDGDTVDISGEGAALSNGILILDRAGTYVLTGAWSNGRIRIEAGMEDTVRLILNGASIHCPDSAPLFASQAGKVIVTLVKDTENVLTDGSTYTYTGGVTELEAALYTQDSLTINGRGALTVTAGFKHGILSKDDLLIENGIITVTAADVGIRGRDTLTISGGEITVDSKGDALQSNNGDDSEKGRITLTGGKYSLTSLKDGIQAESSLFISGGDFTLHTGGVTTAQNQVKPEDWQKIDSASAAPGKGLKAGSSISITGGTFKLYCPDDAVNANDEITIQDGIFDIATRNDGLHAGKSVEISGGKLTINAMKDCIDSSGSVILEGGTLYVSGTGGDTSDAVDFADSFLVEGGSLCASSCKGMVKAPGSDSKQLTLMISFSASVAAGSKVELADDSGKTVFACAPAQGFKALLLSVPEMELGKNYTLSVNGEAVLTTELTDTVTSISLDADSPEG